MIRNTFTSCQEKNVNKFRFSDRLREFMKLHNMSGAELGRRLGVSGQRISQLLHESGKTPSRQLLLAFERLERELDDPFLAACVAILESDDARPHLRIPQTRRPGHPPVPTPTPAPINTKTPYQAQPITSPPCSGSYTESPTVRCNSVTLREYVVNRPDHGLADCGVFGSFGVLGPSESPSVL